MKQVIVIRHDLHMRMGKAVAQGAHASIACMLPHLFYYNAGTAGSSRAGRWVSEGMKKICVRVDSEEELMGVYHKAERAGIEAHLVTDAGHTEFHGNPTLTAAAIGPDEDSKIDEITGALELL